MYTSAKGRAAIGEVAFDFYRCRGCKRLVTQPEMAAAMGPQGSISCCPCGSVEYKPTNPTRLEYLLPRVWTFAIARFWEIGVGGVLANARRPPAPEPPVPGPPPLPSKVPML